MRPCEKLIFLQIPRPYMIHTNTTRLKQLSNLNSFQYNLFQMELKNLGMS